jgi:hypothetical protein
MDISINRAYKRSVYSKMSVFCDHRSVYMSNLIKILLLLLLLLLGYQVTTDDAGRIRNTNRRGEKYL